MKNRVRITVLLTVLTGLMLATFATAPPVNAVSSSPFSVSKMSGGAAGYAGAISSGDITHVTAEWNQPTVTCQPGLTQGQTELTTMGIANSTTFLFITTVGGCNPGSTAPVYGAFVLYALSNPSRLLNGTMLKIAVNPGDTFSASIDLSLSTQILVANITDMSTSLSASATFPHPFFPSKSTVVFWDVPQSAANPLPQFNVPIRFSNCTATVSGQTFTISKIGTVIRLTMVDASGNTMATVSSLSRAGSSFKVTWVSST